MRIVLLFLILGCSLTAIAQDTLQKQMQDTASTYFIKLLDRTSLSGKIIEKRGHEILFNDVSIGKVTIPENKIESMKRLSGSQVCILTTNDGNTYTGILESQNEKEVVIKTESLGRLTIGNSKIKEIRIVDKQQIVNGLYYFPNPHPTRYFFASSAIPLKKGETYFQNIYILMNGVQVGITDHFSVGGGVVVPFAFYLNPKFGFKLAQNVHIGGGIWVASSVLASLSFGVGMGYGSFTLGDNESNVTVNVGLGAARSGNSSWEFASQPMYTVSGMSRLSKRCALISENWFIAARRGASNVYEYNSLFSGGIRILGENNSFDIALVLPFFGGGSTIGFPYFGYVFKF